MHALKPLDSGNILLVGVKASNFGDDIKNNPRVIMWDSQHEHWISKEIPHNVRAVFITRFVGHDAFRNIMSYARKRRITVFNPQGTGMIAKQVGELLAVSKPVPNVVQETIVPEVKEPIKMETEVKRKYAKSGKLKPLAEFIDTTKTIRGNAAVLQTKAQEFGIETTFRSLEYFARVQLIKLRGVLPKGRPKDSAKVTEEVDVAVQMLDEMIKGMNDMRAFLVATTKENKQLKAKLNKMRDWFNE